MEKKTYGLPALISFFIPGLGQIIKGDFLKGFLIWLVGGTAMFLFSITIILIPFAFIIWAWNIYDAYNSNQGGLSIADNNSSKTAKHQPETEIQSNDQITDIDNTDFLKKYGVQFEE